MFRRDSLASRILSAVLTVAMVWAMLPMEAFAEAAQESASAANQPEAQPVASAASQATEGQSSGNQSAADSAASKAATIRFDANGGSGSMDDAKIADCTNFDQKLSASAFTRDGYTFAGWSTTVDGRDQKDSSGNVVTPAIAVPDQADIANWKFSWDANGDGTVDSNTETFDLSSCVKNNELTLYAQWNEKPTASETVAGQDSSQGSNGQEEASENTATNDARNTTDTAQSDSTNDGQDDAAATDNKLTAVPADSDSASTQDDSGNTAGQTTFTAHWTNATDKEISYTNADYDPNDSDTWTDFSCTPSENSPHKSTMKVYLKLAGDSNTTYKAGSVKIYVPAGFYRGLDKEDSLLVACSDSVWSKNPPLSQIDWMIPKAPDTNSVTDFNYVEETQEVNGQQVKYYVMQNTKDLTGTTELDVDIDYRFRPTMLDVTSETQADGTDMGVYHGSYPVFCDVNGKVVENGKRNLGVTVKTKVNPSKITLSHATQDRNKGIFFSWDSAWGKKPKDADKYFYVVWYATYQRGTGTTMPFTYRISIDQSKTDGGELVGVKKYTGDSGNNGFEQSGVVLARMDSYYTGIAGNTDLLNKDWVGVLNDPTKSFAYSAAMCGSSAHDYAINSYWHYQVYALLFRYPLAKVSDAIESGVDMANQGINISNGVTLTENWQDGHTVTSEFGPSGDTSVKSLPAGGGSRELTKVRADEDWRTREVKASQSFLSQGHDMTLPDFTLRSYNYDDKVTWDSKNSSYKASIGFDVKDGDYYLYSAAPDYYAKAPGTDSIAANNPYKLSESEYSLTSFYLDDDEYDVTYKEGLGWQRATRSSDDYSRYSPISIYIRRQGAKDLVKYGEILRNAHGYTFTSEDGSNDVSGVSGSKRVALPTGTVQIEMKQEDNAHYASYVRLHYGIELHPDENLRDRLNQDITSSKRSVVGGFASGEQTVEGSSLGYSDNRLGNYWNYVSYELTPIASSVILYKNVYARTDDMKNDERTIPVSVDYYTQTNVDWDDSAVKQFANSTYMKPYMLTSGIFYDLLPAGTYVKQDEIVVGVRNSASTVAPLADKQVELIPNWNGSGRTMLKVEFHIPDGKGLYIDYWSGVRLNYVLHDPYTNIVDRGGLVTNSAMLVNTSGDDVIFNSNAKNSSYKGQGFSDWGYFKDVAQDAWSKGNEAATTQSRMDFGSVTALQAGFNVRVSTDGDPTYQSSGNVYLGDRYTDRLQYTSAADTRTDNLILYDVFSPEDKRAVGNFESVDVSSIDAKPTYDADNSSTSDTCKPVVYYATQIPDDKTRALDSGIWTTTPPDDLSKVMAVAIDCRKTDAGKDFVLDKKGTLVAYVHLKATTDASCVGRTEKNEALISKRMFIGSTPAESDAVTVQTAERTVKLLAANLSIEKTCDPASGTKDRPAEIGNDANKQLTYTIKVANNAKVSDSLPDVTRIRVKDALPAGLALDTSRDITVSSTSLGIKDGTKISGQSVVSYQSGDDGVSFDIGKLPSEGSVSITVPVVRKDPVEQTTAYTNTAVIESIGNASAEEGNSSGNNSSTTYHVTTVTRMPVAGGGGFAGLVVAGAALLVLSAYGWIRNKRRVS